METEQEPGFAALMAGIVQDARQLVVQQLTLFQVEIKKDLRRAMFGSAAMVIALGVFSAALVLLGAAGALLLSATVPDVPLWGWFAIVGAGVALAGVGLVLWGKTKIEDGVTPENSLEGLKENLQWKTKT
jgi:hypothetical protein